MRLNEFILRLNEEDEEAYPRPKEQLQKLIAEVSKQKDFVESLAQQAQKITTEIKYDDTVSSIIIRIQQLAEKIEFDDQGYKSEIESAIQDAQEAMNNLESAVYGIDEPFKYLLRALDNDLMELESELDEHKWTRESKNLKMPKQRDPNWRTMQAKGTSGASGEHKDKKKDQKVGNVKHKKDMIPMEQTLPEKAPPGFKGTVKAMKKHKEIDNPFALAWSMKNKGYKSHKKADGSDK